jgi:hypothetical protein
MANPKLTVNPPAAPATPTSQVVARAMAETKVTDARGRSITLRRPPVLQQFRLIEALGDSARNMVYVQMVLPLIYVCAIDGQETVPFSKKSEVEAMIQRLDEDGIAAVSKGVAEHFGEPDPDADKARLGN